MTSEQLRRIGERLYGWGWLTRLAADLGVTDRTVRRWAAGDYEIPKIAALAIRALKAK